MKSILILVLTSLLALQTVEADQCMYIDQKESNSALEYLKIGQKYVEFCEPCGDTQFYQQEVKIIKYLKVDSVDKKQWEISLNKTSIDLAYTYVKDKGSSFKNLSKLANCESDNVSIAFPAIQTATIMKSHYIPKANEKYQQYCNDRFGFCLDHPSILKKYFSENGDGITLQIGNLSSQSNNAFKINVYGSPHGNMDIAPHTVKDIMNSAKKRVTKITFQKKKDNWFALSGYIDSGDTIFYEKTYVGKQNSNTLMIQYPKKYKKRFDNVVNRVVASFKQGDLD
jgi:hypothetical protein